jgi:predicted dehydrogenase
VPIRSASGIRRRKREEALAGGQARVRRGSGAGLALAGGQDGRVGATPEAGLLRSTIDGEGRTLTHPRGEGHQTNVKHEGDDGRGLLERARPRGLDRRRGPRASTEDIGAVTVSEGSDQVRWGIVGTANIARAQFLPGLREAGGGRPVLVASRSLPRAEAFAAEHGIERGVADYAAVVESPDLDAVYVALPNSLHAEWTKRAVEAGKAVLSEKPLCVGSVQTAEVLDVVAITPGALLWEAFVFPFQDQHRRLVELAATGAIGEVTEVVSAFYFRPSRAGNIRFSAVLGGGALADVGCYPIRLAYELFGAERAEVVAGSAVVEGDVEVDAAGMVTYGARRLVLGCGFNRSFDAFTRVLGDGGQIHLTNPFHPGPDDTLTLHRPGADPVVEHPTTDAHSFTAAVRHIHAVLHGDATPEHTASESALANAATLEALQAACGLR